MYMLTNSGHAVKCYVGIVEVSKNSIVLRWYSVCHRAMLTTVNESAFKSAATHTCPYSANSLGLCSSAALFSLPVCAGWWFVTKGEEEGWCPCGYLEPINKTSSDDETVPTSSLGERKLFPSFSPPPTLLSPSPSHSLFHFLLSTSSYSSLFVSLSSSLSLSFFLSLSLPQNTSEPL